MSVQMMMGTPFLVAVGHGLALWGLSLMSCDGHFSPQLWDFLEWLKKKARLFKIYRSWNLAKKLVKFMVLLVNLWQGGMSFIFFTKRMRFAGASSGTKMAHFSILDDMVGHKLGHLLWFDLQLCENFAEFLLSTQMLSPYLQKERNKR